MYADPVVRKILLCQPALNAQDAAAVSDQVRSGWIGPGPRTEEFQKAIADVAGKKYCAATTSGTVATVSLFLCFPRWRFSQVVLESGCFSQITLDFYHSKVL